MNKQLVNKAKSKFLSKLENYGDDPWSLRIHIQEAEKWSERLLKRFPEANKEVIILSVWLHDIGHYPIPSEDHAVVSEREAKEFLENEKVDSTLTKQVLHCIRSHRNRDIKPATFDAKLFAMIDSISHFTYIPYTAMAQDGRVKDAMEKLERDYRDISPFPEVKKEITPLYKALKKLLIELGKIELV